MKRSDQAGFSIVETLLILVIIGILCFTGWFVYRAKQTTNKNYAAATSSTAPKYKKKATANTTEVTPSSYTGWKTYSSSDGLGLGFKYPATWNVTESDPTQAQHDPVTATLMPPTSEVRDAFNQIGASYTAPSRPQADGPVLGSYYYIDVTKAGQPMATPGGDQSGVGGVYNWDGQKFNYLSSTDAMSSGVLKGDWLTFYGSVEDSTKSAADAMVITNNQYGSTDAKFTESTILTLKGAQYQIAPQMGERFGQYGVQTTINTTKFKTTDLYKDTLLVLNSMQ